MPAESKSFTILTLRRYDQGWMSDSAALNPYAGEVDYRALAEPYLAEYGVTELARYPESHLVPENLNPFIMPQPATNTRLAHMRIRVSVGPGLRVDFSSNTQLGHLGFTKKGFLTPTRGSAVILANRSMDSFLSAIGDKAPAPAVGPRSNITIDVRKNRTVAKISKKIAFRLSSDAQERDELMVTPLAGVLADISAATNVKASVMYDAAEKKFKFTFPPRGKLRQTYHLSENIALRIGSLSTEISEEAAATGFPWIKTEQQEEDEEMSDVAAAQDGAPPASGAESTAPPPTPAAVPAASVTNAVTEQADDLVAIGEQVSEHIGYIAVCSSLGYSPAFPGLFLGMLQPTPGGGGFSLLESKHETIPPMGTGSFLSQMSSHGKLKLQLYTQSVRSCEFVPFKPGVNMRLQAYVRVRRGLAHAAR